MKFDCSYTDESGLKVSLAVSASLSCFAPLSGGEETPNGDPNPASFLAERCLLEISSQLVSAHRAIERALSVASIDLHKSEVDSMKTD